MFNLLKENDKVGLISPASFITKEKLTNSIKNLKSFKLIPVYYESVLERHGYFAGTDESRVNELHKMYVDKSIKAMLCVRGGYGASRIVELLDYNLIKNNPKPLIGYSDITALLIAIYKNTGQFGFHGVVGASVFSDYTAHNFKEIFFKKKDVINYNISKNDKYEQYTICSGKASGELVGGNLAILVSLLATKNDIEWANKIVFIEEINEPPYKIDRMLTQLIQANKFVGVKGIIFGQFNKCEGSDFNVKIEDTFTIKEIISNLIKPLKIPSAYGISFGHVKDQIIFPIGVKANFNANKMQVSIKNNFIK